MVASKLQLIVGASLFAVGLSLIFSTEPGGIGSSASVWGGAIAIHGLLILALGCLDNITFYRSPLGVSGQKGFDSVLVYASMLQLVPGMFLLAMNILGNFGTITGTLFAIFVVGSDLLLVVGNLDEYLIQKTENKYTEGYGYQDD